MIGSLRHRTQQPALAFDHQPVVAADANRGEQRAAGKRIPRRADQQAQSAGLLKIDREELKPGDLVFFNTMRRAFSHVGIYIGEDRFIHAPRAGKSVRVEDMRAAYWARRFDGARRAELALAEPAAALTTLGAAAPTR